MNLYENIKSKHKNLEKAKLVKESHLLKINKKKLKNLKESSKLNEMGNFAGRIDNIRLARTREDEYKQDKVHQQLKLAKDLFKGLKKAQGDVLELCEIGNLISAPIGWDGIYLVNGDDKYLQLNNDYKHIYVTPKAIHIGNEAHDDIVSIEDFEYDYDYYGRTTDMELFIKLAGLFIDKYPGFIEEVNQMLDEYEAKYPKAVKESQKINNFKKKLNEASHAPSGVSQHLHNNEVILIGSEMREYLQSLINSTGLSEQDGSELLSKIKNDDEYYRLYFNTESGKYQIELLDNASWGIGESFLEARYVPYKDVTVIFRHTRTAEDTTKEALVGYYYGEPEEEATRSMAKMNNNPLIIDMQSPEDIKEDYEALMADGVIKESHKFIDSKKLNESTELDDSTILLDIAEGRNVIKLLTTVFKDAKELWNETYLPICLYGNSFFFSNGPSFNEILVCTKDGPDVYFSKINRGGQTLLLSDEDKKFIMDIINGGQAPTKESHSLKNRPLLRESNPAKYLGITTSLLEKVNQNNADINAKIREALRSKTAARKYADEFKKAGLTIDDDQREGVTLIGPNGRRLYADRQHIYGPSKPGFNGTHDKTDFYRSVAYNKQKWKDNDAKVKEKEDELKAVKGLSRDDIIRKYPEDTTEDALKKHKEDIDDVKDDIKYYKDSRKEKEESLRDIHDTREKAHNSTVATKDRSIDKKDPMATKIDYKGYLDSKDNSENKDYNINNYYTNYEKITPGQEKRNKLKQLKQDVNQTTYSMAAKRILQDKVINNEYIKSEQKKLKDEYKQREKDLKERLKEDKDRALEDYNHYKDKYTDNINALKQFRKDNKLKARKSKDFDSYLSDRAKSW